MIRKKKQGVVWLEFELFQPFSHKISHGVFLRHGGVSMDAFDSLNAGLNRGDLESNVSANRIKISSALDIGTIQFPNQVHGSNICIAIDNIDKCDGLISQDRAIGITHADCQAALLYDPVHNICAAVHAGWRGMVKNIYKEAVQQLVEAFGSNPKEILVGISPSLGPAHSEFKHYQDEFPEHFWKYQVKDNYFNLWKLGRDQLQECGIQKDHIEIAEICTYETDKDCFSYRRSKTTGVHATVIAVRQPKEAIMDLLHNTLFQ